MLDNTRKPAQKIYKSPIRKLSKLFKNSRNQWKAKCRKAKYKIKLLKNKIQYLEKSKDNLKMKLKRLENELERMKSKEIQMEKEINDLKKNYKNRGNPIS